MVGGRSTNSYFVASGMIPSPGMVKQKQISLLHPPLVFSSRRKNLFTTLPPFFPVWQLGGFPNPRAFPGGFGPPHHLPYLIPLNMSLVGHVIWKCILFSDLKISLCILFSELKTLEAYTIFGTESLGSVYYSWGSKPWKCIVFPDLNTLEVYTIFGTENLGSVYYVRKSKPWRVDYLRAENLASLCTMIIVHACTMILGHESHLGGWSRLG